MRDFVGKLLLKWRIKAILPLINGALLDIGCGTNDLVQNYRQGIGVDVFDWGNVDLIVDDTSKLPFEDKKFDTITIIAALNHIPNRIDVLQECHRILKNDGQIIITMITPRFSKIWHKIREPWDVDQKIRGMKEKEVFGFRNKELVNIFNNSGFKLNEVSRFMFLLNRIYIFSKMNKNN